MKPKISPEKLKQAEGLVTDLIKRAWEQTHDKKKLARIITFFVIAVAVIQELFLGTQLSDGWCEITIYLLMGYFGMATYRSSFNRYFK